MTAAIHPLATWPTATTDDRPAVQFVTGRDPVLRLSRKLMEFSARCGQAGAMHDVGYFLAKPGALPRVPHLLLVSRTGGLNVDNPDLDELLGLVLIFEQKVSGIGVGAFATNDRSGRGNLVARPEDRSRVAGLAARALLDRGAHLVLMSFRADEDELAGAARRPLLSVGAQGADVARWARRDRAIPGYLPLAVSFDETMASVGQHTRRNLRYYRRRAETGLGCRFVPEVEITREELLAFNRDCMYATPAEVAGWRYDSLKDLGGPVFMGIKDGAGRWLSLLGGRRYQDRSEILWQLNRKGFPAYSLGTVMRAYFIEHEIGQRSRRLYIEGGTPHSIKFSFMPEALTDLVVVRRTLQARLMRTIAQRYIKPDNELSHMLEAKDLEWLPC
jgi:hypothetical protein